MSLRTTLRSAGRALLAVYIGRPNGVRRRFLRRILRRVSRASEDPTPPEAQVPEPPAAPHGFVDVCALEELEEGTIGEFFIDDEAVAIANVDGTIHALSNVCPHAGGPLGDGTLDGGVVACPWHGWAFDVRTGICTLDPGLEVRTYEVRIQAGRILVALEAS